VLSRDETLRYTGRFSLAFAAAVFLLGRYYENPGLISIALGVAIIGVLTLMDARRAALLHPRHEPARPSRPVPRPSRPSGRFE